jgi:hypothetical protein
MKFIKIVSKGEIDEKAFYLLGASSKRDDKTKIGMYGSGLKYSLAFMLKKEIPFRVFSGYKEIKFSTKSENFRDKSFSVIYVNEKETSLTTDMGNTDWNCWSIIREIFSNSIDEGEAGISLVESKSIDALEPVEDFTTFYIKASDEFQEIMDNWDLYFSNRRKDLIYHDDNFNQLYNGGDSSLIYRKGIRCHFSKETKSIFHYDLDWVKINESRVLENDWEFKYKLVAFLRPIESKDVIHRILHNINSYWEKDLNWKYHAHIPFSDTWLTEIGEKWLVPYENAGFWVDDLKDLDSRYIIIPNELIEALKVCFGDKIKIIGDGSTGEGRGDKKIINELNKKESYLLDESVKFLTEAGYEIKYPIKVAKFVNAEILGLAENDTIFISDKCLTMGKREIINTIIEESQHLKTGFKDETRAFQTDLINLSISLMEEKLGRYL